MSEIGSNCVDTLNVSHSSNSSDYECDSDYTDEEVTEGTTISVPENVEFEDIYLEICDCAKDNSYRHRTLIKTDYYLEMAAIQQFKTTTIGILYIPQTRKLEVNVHKEVELPSTSRAPPEQSPFTLICNAIHSLIADISSLPDLE